MNAPIKVIYILGLGHSGSTLLDLILGSHSQIESVGEIKQFGKYWQTFSDNSVKLEKKDRCTCGVHVHECEYWNKVKHEMEANCKEFNTLPDFDNKEQYNLNNYCLLKAILKVTGKKIICDSSKNPLRLESFLKSDLFEVFIIHLVRDSRAVAYSWARKGVRAGKAKEPQYNYYKVLKTWRRFNKNSYLQFSSLSNYFFLKYENLANNPQKIVSEILERNNLEFESDQLQFWKFKHHNIYGNRIRTRGEQEIKIDGSYLEYLTPQEWWLGTLMTMTGLRRFNYPLQR